MPQHPNCDADDCPSRERRACGWIALTAILSFAVLALPFFLGRIYIADDLGDFHLPVRDFYARQLERGEAFDWMPSLFGGFYVTAEGQLGAYHPWHWLLYRWLPLGAAFDLEVLSSYPLLFAGAYLFFRRLVERRDAALLGAMTFTFSGFCLLHFMHPNAIAVVAHLPWMLWAIDLSLRSSDRWKQTLADAGLALLLASQLLLGYPQYVWFSLLTCAALVIWRVTLRQAPARRVVLLCVPVACGVLIGAAQWIPTWHLLHESVRRDADLRFSATGSLPPLNALQLVAPYLWKTRVVGQNTIEMGMYAGAVPLVLCVWLLARREQWGRYRPLIWSLLVFVGVAFWLAMGEYGGLHRLQAYIPFANRFRCPCRAIVLVHLGIAALTAVAAAILFADAQSERDSRPKPEATGAASRARPLALLLAASVLVALLGPLATPRYVASPLLVWLGPLVIAIGALLVLLVERGTRGAVAALAAFAAIDLLSYGMTFSIVGHTADMHALIENIERPPGQTPARIVAPGSYDGMRSGDRMLLAGLSRADGYAGLEPARRLDYGNLRTWQLAGAEWVWVGDEADSGALPRWARISPTAPRVRLITESSAGRVETNSAGNWHVAHVEPPLALPNSTPGEYKLLNDSPGMIVLEVSLPARQVLATTESYDSGWTARIDGQPAAIVRVDGDFLGTPVEAGRHLVRLEFRPWSRRLGVLVSSCGLGLLVAYSGIRLLFAPHTKRRGSAPCCDHHSTTC